MEQLVNYAAGLAAVAVLGLVKKYTGIADTKIGQIAKPVQPVIALGLATVIPYVAHAAHVTAQVDPAQVAAAPTATIVGIAAAEVLSRLRRKQ